METIYYSSLRNSFVPNSEMLDGMMTVKVKKQIKRKVLDIKMRFVSGLCPRRIQFQ
jgi:hypothetical protein